MVMVTYKNGYVETVSKKIFEGLMLVKRREIFSYQMI